MNEYEIGKDIGNLSEQLRKLRAQMSDLASPLVTNGDRPIIEDRRTAFIEGFDGDPVGLNDDGTYVWDIESSVSPIVDDTQVPSGVIPLVR